jgi:UDP-N-acetylmuramate dehydrogenase
VSAVSNANVKALIEAIRATPLAASLTLHAALGELTSYRVGGPAAALLRLESPAHIDLLASCVANAGVPILNLGRGSNVLVSDRGFDGLVVMLGDQFAEIEVAGTSVTVGAAAKLPVVARTTTQAGLSGFAWAVGVPGSVGGAVRMNAGGHGAEMADVVTSAEVLDLDAGERKWIPVAELNFGYRYSAIAASDLVLSVRLELQEGDPVQGKAEMLEVVKWRREHQPGGQNAGSVFTNPADDSAGRLIDAAGLKGFRIGSAEVSEKHANFIQADAGGRAADVLGVMNEIVRRVHDTHGVILQRETVLVGFEPSDEFEPGA